MAKPKDTKRGEANGKTKKGGSRKGGVSKGRARTSAASPTDTSAAARSATPATSTLPSVISALASVTDAAHVEAALTSSQCIVWRLGEFRQRVTQAVAQWAQESASAISSSDTLGALAKGTPWNVGQQAQLVNSVNANKVFEPPFPGTVMSPPSQLVPPSTTVLQWEAIVWRHQNPLTPCFPFTD
jgi:hypothetical protein